MKNNTNKDYILYSDKEKEIFINLFIRKSHNSRRNFNLYVNQYFKALPGKNKPFLLEKREEDSRCSQHRFTSLKNLNKIQYNTHNILWDIKHKDNLITYFLSDSDFTVSNSNIYSLNRIHPDWNHQNKNGLNALMLLSVRKNLDTLIKVADDFTLDLNKKDKDDKYFTHFLFSEIPNEPLGTNYLSRVKAHITHVEKLIDMNPSHFNISHIRLGRIINEWENTISNLKSNFENDENWALFVKATNDIEEQSSKILTKILSYKLGKTLRVKNEKKSLSIKI